MDMIDTKQKETLFDYLLQYHLGILNDGESGQIEKVIIANPQAKELYAQIKSSLAPMDHFAEQECPDELVEATVFRLKNTARSSDLQLKSLLEREQARSVFSPKKRYWFRLSEMAAVAAVIIFVAGVLIMPLKSMRQTAFRKQCEYQLSHIYTGLNNYISDNDGQLPQVAANAGQPWWKIGYQGDENLSNTRNAWLLIKNGYVQPKDFVCPGRREGKSVQIDPDRVSAYNDFPSRKYITYSFRVLGKPCTMDKIQGKVLVADLNPLFEELPKNYTEPLLVKVNEELKQINSSNHNRQGQSVLFCNGSVKFHKDRQVGESLDDIFTLRDTNVYKGFEIPQCERDAFLAP